MVSLVKLNKGVCGMLMNLKKPRIFFVSVCFVLLIQTGCFSATPSVGSNDEIENGVSNEINIPGEDSGITPTAISIPSKTPSTVGITTAFPSSTLTPLHLQLLNQKLNDEVCLLPCYLGIVPSETSIDEVKIILEELGATLSYGSPYEIREGLENYTYHFDIVVDNSQLVQHTINLDVQQNKLLEFRVDIDQRESDIFYEYWSKYSLRNMLTNLGFPDFIYINIGGYDFYPGYSITLIYEEQEIYYTIYGQKQDGLVCPLFKEGIIGLIQIRIIDSDYDEGLEGIPSSYDRTIQEVFEISDQQFYDQVLANSEACFEPINSE